MLEGSWRVHDIGIVNARPTAQEETMSDPSRKLELVLPAEDSPAGTQTPVEQNRLLARKAPGSVPAQRTADGAPWSFIDEIESHAGLYTVADLAAVLQRSTCSIYRMAHRKQLPSLRLGGLLYFDPAALGMLFRKKSPESAAAARFSGKVPRSSGNPRKRRDPAC
jgi:hypothetical protein